MIIITTAPQAYDYSYTEEVTANLFLAPGERAVRITTPNGCDILRRGRAIIQRERYASGLYPSRINGATHER